MFYSHEVLTSRKHGVATIWLMATLGSKSSHKKITRKAILDVDLARACETVTQPEVPLALRLQGSLLIGISRVFGQQCEYMRADVENLEVKMKKSLLSKASLQTDPSLARSRPDLITLPDDPAFNVDLDLGLDFSFFGFSHQRSEDKNTLADYGQGASQSSLRTPEQTNHPNRPSFSLHLDPENLLRSDPAERGFASEEHRTSSGAFSGPAFEQQAIFDDPGMLVMDDGQLVFQDDLRAPENLSSTSVGISSTIPAPAPALAYSENVLSGQMVGQEIDDGFDEFRFSIRGDEQMPITQPSFDHGSESLQPNGQGEMMMPLALNMDQTTVADAPQTQSRTQRLPQPDRNCELPSSKLMTWGTTYLDNMEKANQIKMSRISAGEAKRNAAFWVLDQGIGGVAVNFGADAVPHPFSIFSGQYLLESLHDQSSSRKRSRSDSHSSHEEEAHRRIRVRPLDQEASQHNGQIMEPAVDDDGGILQAEGDLQPESEVGRQAEGSLKDQSSQMPWNLSSRRGSARIYSGLVHRVSSMAGSAVGSLELGPPSILSRHRPRMTSASPLLGKGRSLSRDFSPEGLSHSSMAYDIDDFSHLDDKLAADIDDEFELYGPAARVSTQQADESQWLATILEAEGQNFLDFLTTSISEQPVASTTFTALLPPRENSQTVAAQALLHVLTLATKGLIEVKQEQGFADITLTLSSSATNPSNLQPED